ncbi:hypothetical protein HanIR_Chr01g0033861 [Helianthus annuus]|nr:hypothetical protein HanIR_Chr01g0033861 [Helianthus annuus]
MRMYFDTSISIMFMYFDMFRYVYICFDVTLLVWTINTSRGSVSKESLYELE